MLKNAYDRVAQCQNHTLNPLAQRNMAFSELKKSLPADSALLNNFITMSCHKRWERAWEGDASCSSPPCLHVNEDESSLDRPKNLIDQNTRWSKHAVASQRISMLGTLYEVRIIQAHRVKLSYLCLSHRHWDKDVQSLNFYCVFKNNFVNQIDNSRICELSKRCLMFNRQHQMISSKRQIAPKKILFYRWCWWAVW